MVAAAKNVLSGKTIPIDIVRVINAANTYYSFLSIGWGLIADIDIESERLRILGGNRFAVWALVRTLSLRRYPGRLHYRPVHDFDCKRLGKTASESVHKVKRERFRRPSRAALSDQSCESNDTSYDVQFSSSESSPSLPNVKSKSKSGRSFSLNFRSRFRKNSKIDSCEEALESCDSRSKPSEYLDVQLTKYQRIDGRDTVLDDKRQIQKTELPDSSSDLVESPSKDSEFPETNHSTSPIDPLPTDWKTVEGDFVLVYATYQTHISHDCIIAPNARPDDNVIWLLYLTGTSVIHFLLV